jgi:hypothetical protein
VYKWRSFLYSEHLHQRPFQFIITISIWNQTKIFLNNKRKVLKSLPKHSQIKLTFRSE